jgi:hypothetical protein
LIIKLDSSLVSPCSLPLAKLSICGCHTRSDCADPPVYT